jgi:hypothetical protein
MATWPIPRKVWRPPSLFNKTLAANMSFQQTLVATRLIPIGPWWPWSNIFKSLLTYCHETKYAQFITNEPLIPNLHLVIVKQIDSKQKTFITSKNIIDRELNKIFQFLLFVGLDFILLQKISLHMEEQGLANFSYRGLEGRMCLILLKGLHFTIL